jgi:hypothetical protein
MRDPVSHVRILLTAIEIWLHCCHLTDGASSFVGAVVHGLRGGSIAMSPD